MRAGKSSVVLVVSLMVIGLSLAVAGIGAVAWAATRTWTDSSGKHKIEAEFAGLEDGVVTLKKENGQTVKVPISKLSAEDRQWVARNRRKFAADTTEVATPAQGGMADTTDWPRWRGQHNDGISRETGLLKSWPDGGPDVLWSSRGLGRGYSSVAVVGDKIYTMGKKDNVKLICVSNEDGSPVWETAVGGGSDPNCTPTVDIEAGLVYGISHAGDLLCANAETGEAVWRKNFGRDFSGKMMSGWGYSESPLIDGDRLICTPGSDDGVLAALNKKTGEVIWQTRMPGGRAGYASPVISNGGGVKQYVTLVGKGLIGVAADDGRLLWNYDRIANGTANVPTPLIAGDFVFGSSGYGDGGSALVQLVGDGRGGVTAREVYYKRNNEVQNHHGGMVLIGDHIYMGHGHNNGLPMCLNIKTGRVLWGPERGAGSGSAAMMAADGHLYFRYENGTMALIEATPTRYNLKGSFRIKSVNGKSWQHPVISDKKLYLRDQDELHVYDIAAG